MALQFSDAGSGSSSAAPTSYAFTPTQANGDLFVVHIVLGDSGRTISAPSGWTADYNTGGPKAGQQHALFSKVVDGSEPTPFTFSWTGGGSNRACTALRVHSTTGTVAIANMTVSETATDGASPYTTASITASSNPVIYGVGGEGTAASITWSQAHGDTEIADTASGSGTGEAAAVYHSGNLSGSISRTVTASSNDRFAATWWIANVTEDAPPPETDADAGTSAPTVTSNNAVQGVGARAALYVRDA